MMRARTDQVNVTSEEVYAYLEAHFHNPKRVEVVVQELLHRTDSRSGSSSPEIIEVKVNQNTKGKGGKGKRSVTAVTTGLKRPALKEDDHHVSLPMKAKKKVSPHHTSSSHSSSVDQKTEDLAENFSAMFPLTPRHYILSRLSQLGGNDAAVNNLMEELLSDPEPPPGWDSNQLPTVESEPEVVIVEDERQEESGEKASSSVLWSSSVPWSGPGD